MSLAHFLKISPKLIRPKTQGEEVLEETWNTIPHGGEAGLPTCTCAERALGPERTQATGGKPGQQDTGGWTSKR